MSKKILIIESDKDFSAKLRAAFEAKGFTVAETGDGKSALDTAKREKPELVVLSVELSAGQSGYIVCGKLKKDDELAKVPVVIIGKDAEGFKSHKKLKARAEEYLQKPFEAPTLIEKVGALIGFPAAAADELVMDEDESLGLGNLTEDEPLTKEEDVKVEEVAVEADERPADADLDMLDSAFENISESDQGKKDEDAALDSLGSEEAVTAPPEEGLVEDPNTGEDKALSGLGAESDEALESLEIEKPAEEEVALEAIEPEEPKAPLKAATPAPAVRAPRSAAAAVVDDTELRALREQVSELESKVNELQDEISSKTNELEAVRSTTGGKDKEFFALKEANTKKDKELLRLKQDLHEKETQSIELQEKETALEQKTSELTTELAKRDGQLKTLTQKVDSLGADKKKTDAAVAAAKDETRQMSVKLSAAQGEVDQLQDEVAAVRKELEAAQADQGGTRTALEAMKEQFEAQKKQLDEQTLELEGARNDVTAKSSQWEEESRTLRERIATLEESNTKNEERAVKAYQKIKVDEKLKEKTRKALAVALEMLDEQAATGDGSGKVEEEEALS